MGSEAVTTSHELKIIGVTLLDRSLKTYRELADDRRDVYPVVVTLSRPVHDPFELKCLFDELDQPIPEQPDRLRPLAAFVLLQRHFSVLLSNRRPARNRCRAGALARITDHAAARQGRFVLRSLSCEAATIPVPAADHHWPRPLPDLASPRPATRPRRSGT